jgi:hypothetical protein
MESKIVGNKGPGEQGDGSYQCRLFQRGAQKIIGFEFGASVTMDMKEQIVTESERIIGFKCVDSFFFNEFDGEWRVKEEADEIGRPQSIISYVVDVRPKGPVPVAALEWRIREDVPTNLRAVKKAALDVGYNGVMAKSPHRVKKAHDGQHAKGPLSRINVNWDRDETMAAYLSE